MADNAEQKEGGAKVAPMTALLFQEPDLTRAVRSRRQRREDAREEAPESAPEVEQSDDDSSARKRRRGKRGGRKSADNVVQAEAEVAEAATEDTDEEKPPRPRRSRKKAADTAKEDAGEKEATEAEDDSSDSDGEAEETTTVRRRRRRRSSEEADDGVTAPKGSTRLEAKKRRRKEGRRAGRRRTTISESEYLARREAVDRTMLVREQDGLNQIAVLEDGVLVEHYVARHTQTSMVGNVYLGRVQNVLPSMEAAFVDIGKGRNAVLYAGEVNWDAVGMNGKPRKIEDALKSGDTVLVQVTKDPIGHKGARLTGQITLAGRHLVLVPGGSMTGISRKLPEKERTRLKNILKKVVPSEHGVIVRTAAEGATEEQLQGDVDRLAKAWVDIQAKSKSTKNAPSMLKSEPELAVRVVRDIFNEDFNQLKVAGDEAWTTIHDYVEELSPELVDRLEHWESDKDIFAASRVDEQLAKAFDRKVFLPSGGSLIIERTEAMTVIDVNTGKFTGSGGSLEETVTRNNLEAAEEIVRQLRLRDIGGIIVVDFIDMVLEENRDLVLRRLIECLGRDRTRHQVAEVTSLGLVQMTRKRVGQGLVEAFSTTCECCEGRGYITHENPVERGETEEQNPRTNPRRQHPKQAAPKAEDADPKHEEVRAALANIAAAASSKHEAEGKDYSAEDSPDTQPAAKESAKGEDKVERPTKRRGKTGKKSSAGAAATPDQAKESPRDEAEVNPVAEQLERLAQKASEKAASKSSEPEQPKRQRRRRVTSSGAITPGSGASSAIMTFPAEPKADS
ncbi:Rne/Rng family ribonuclease [Trueperella pecoris]|uniref:Rne/Rng family ribonuclease n=1 Tax=Trueperella pecoris TaxID=2733571 RepID=UPI00186B7321|nr:Rne/Rng family ribonuclease [Trueperella pecoris]QOQ38613.1 Rne/Rng family ribonuclease [Trueperella pecoris]